MIYYTHAKAFGNIYYIYDVNGNIVVTYKYDAWGKAISTTGSLASTIGTINPYRYKSYYFDTETNLYYLQSRYYDADVHRFISPDEIEYLGATKRVYECNFYTYCDDDPINYDDSSGCLIWPGEIHAFVQAYAIFLLLKYYSILAVPEYPIKYSWISYKRADLYAPKTGEVWEIKPDKKRYRISGINQLNDYIKHIKGSKYGRDFGVIVASYYSRTGAVYKVTIRCNTGNGMIYYRYDTDVKKSVLLLAGALCIVAIAIGVGAPAGAAGLGTIFTIM